MTFYENTFVAATRTLHAAVDSKNRSICNAFCNTLCTCCTLRLQIYDVIVSRFIPAKGSLAVDP